MSGDLQTRLAGGQSSAIFAGRGSRSMPAILMIATCRHDLSDRAARWLFLSIAVGFLQRSPNILMAPQCGAVFLVRLSQADNKIGGVWDEHLNDVVDLVADIRARRLYQPLGHAPHPKPAGETEIKMAHQRALTGYSRRLR
jgi:hypothetical protein